MRKLLNCLLGLVCLGQTALSQTIQVSGKISEDKGVPIAGASVQEKNSKY